MCAKIHGEQSTTRKLTARKQILSPQKYPYFPALVSMWQEVWGGKLERGGRHIHPFPYKSDSFVFWTGCVSDAKMNAKKKPHAYWLCLWEVWIKFFIPEQKTLSTGSCFSSWPTRLVPSPESPSINNRAQTDRTIEGKHNQRQMGKLNSFPFK